jgi:hypothetical protein
MATDLEGCDHDFQWHPLSDDFGVCSICGAEADALSPGPLRRRRMAECSTPGCPRTARWTVSGVDFDGTHFEEESCESCYSYLAEAAYLCDRPLEAKRVAAPGPPDGRQEESA